MQQASVYRSWTVFFWFPEGVDPAADNDWEFFASLVSDLYKGHYGPLMVTTSFSGQPCGMYLIFKHRDDAMSAAAQWEVAVETVYTEFLDHLQSKREGSHNTEGGGEDVKYS